MGSSKSFKKGDRVRHRFTDEGVLSVLCYSYDGTMVHCKSDNGGYGTYFTENLELDKNSIIYDIIQQL